MTGDNMVTDKGDTAMITPATVSDAPFFIAYTCMCVRR